MRGLDYYSRTTWEFVGPIENENATISGGGRYDDLVEEIGGPPTPGVGFGAGIERLLLALEEEGVTRSRSLRSRSSSRSSADAPRELVAALAGPSPGAGESRRDTDYAARSLKGQLTQAGRLGATTTVVVTADGATLRRTGSADEQVALDDVLARVIG